VSTIKKLARLRCKGVNPQLCSLWSLTHHIRVVYSSIYRENWVFFLRKKTYFLLYSLYNILKFKLVKWAAASHHLSGWICSVNVASNCSAPSSNVYTHTGLSHAIPIWKTFVVVNAQNDFKGDGGVLGVWRFPATNRGYASCDWSGGPFDVPYTDNGCIWIVFPRRTRNAYVCCATLDAGTFYYSCDKETTLKKN